MRQTNAFRIKQRMELNLPLNETVLYSIGESALSKQAKKLKTLGRVERIQQCRPALTIFFHFDYTL
jgi:hypothetical protein